MTHMALDGKDGHGYVVFHGGGPLDGEILPVKRSVTHFSAQGHIYERRGHTFHYVGVDDAAVASEVEP